MEGLNPEILQEICSARMPFGKYKDTVIADLPINYLEWFHREGMPKGKLGMQLSTIYEIKINGLKFPRIYWTLVRRWLRRNNME